MSTAMWDAREVLIPGSAYDRSGNYNGAVPPRHQYYRTHDQIGMINPQLGLQAQQAAATLPVPMSMYMNPTVPPNYFAAPQPGKPTFECMAYQVVC